MTMTRIIISGCNGRMGRTVAERIAARDDCIAVAGIDINTSPLGFPVFASAADCTVDADVIIDFSNPSALPALLELAVSHKIPAVIATTGISDEGKALIEEASKSIPVFFSANMSLGVNLLVELARKAADVLGGDFDIEIVEKHHNQKLDAPSGTALMIADAIADGKHYVYDRHSVRRKRGRDEIGIHSVRGGNIVGEHDVIFAGTDEVITLSHSAASRGVFAAGAVNAAIFLAGKQPGIYNMGDLIAG